MDIRVRGPYKMAPLPLSRVPSLTKDKEKSHARVLGVFQLRKSKKEGHLS
jgi:hypothetical protein